jgi:hypothetical protein
MGNRQLGPLLANSGLPSDVPIAYYQLPIYLLPITYY